MVEKTLEFRGIPLHYLMDYLQELDGKLQSEDFPYIFQGPYWQAHVLREEELRITSTFYVNAVHIQFQAETEEQLEQLIAQYRKKTFRAGA